MTRRADSSESETVFSDSPTGEISLDTLEEAVETLSKALGLRSVGDKILADLSASWEFILCGVILSMFICLLWIVMMRWTAGILIWTSMRLHLDNPSFDNCCGPIQTA